jgi:hypothetical protein
MGNPPFLPGPCQNCIPITDGIVVLCCLGIALGWWILYQENKRRKGR